MKRADIIDAARCLLDTPFRHQGRTPGWALDCAGVVVHVASVFELEYFDQTGYSRHPSDGLLESALDAQPCLVRVASSEIKPGDVLLMRFDSDPQHLAIYAGFNPLAGSETIIHAEIRARKVCEHRFSDDWRGHVVRAYRFIGAES